MNIFATPPYMNNFTQNFTDNFIQIVGNPMYIGLILILFFFFLIVVSKLTIDIAVVIYIPVILVCSVFIPPLRILFAIVIGILIAVGILRLIGKR